MDKVIIAEIGSVHDGSFGNAGKLVEAAAASGADVVKFQTHIAASETLRNAPMPPYFKGEPRYEYFERTSFNREQWTSLRLLCQSLGVHFLSSPFSIDAVDLLEDIGADAYKVASGEVSNVPLLERIAATRKPVILSSGMSNWRELDAAVRVLETGGPLTTMQCTSAYPCPPERVGLNVLDELRQRYGKPVGYSDHTLGSAAAFAAAALGATAIEKHFTFSRLMYGSDAPNSMEPDEFRAFANGIRDIWTMLEHPIDKSDIAAYAQMKSIFEKSVVTSKPLPAGHMIQKSDLAFKKPGDGIPASEWESIAGRKTTRALEADHKFERADFN